MSQCVAQRARLGVAHSGLNPGCGSTTKRECRLQRTPLPRGWWRRAPGYDADDHIHQRNLELLFGGDRRRSPRTPYNVLFSLPL